jgi:hypothetical protein
MIVTSIRTKTRHWQGSRTTVALALIGALAGCSFVLDSDKVQCQVDSDCNSHFEGHPVCQEGVCKDLGLGPQSCFLGTPTNQSQYLNACSTSRCVPFDNCDRLGLCSGATVPAASEPSFGRSPAVTNPVQPPAVDVTCETGMPPGNVIYLYGSADFGPLLRAAQPSLYAQSPPYRAVFQGTTSCNGVDTIFRNDGARPTMKNPVDENLGGWAFYFDENRNQINCRLPAGAEPHIGISNLYAPTCTPGLTPGSAVAEYLGPVVPFVLSVPAMSSQESISAEALHFVFGLGGKAPAGSGMKDAAPWVDHNNYFIRNAGAGSTVLTALMIDVDKSKFWGIDRLSTENLRDALLVSKDADSAIGILSIDFNDKLRGNLKALFLQAKNQNCGYQPDSTPTTFDKINVRDGHYPLWGYVHLFTRLTGGEPSQQAKAMALLFNLPKLEQRLVDDMIEASLVPQCAMTVARTSEMGDYQAKTGFQCGCYFDFKTRGRTSCQVCAVSEECPGDRPSCNYGYCEKN